LSGYRKVSKLTLSILRTFYSSHDIAPESK
jgi:hypothetical protein